MVGVTKKRRRAEVEFPGSSSKRKPVAEDEDIDSDDAGSAADSESISGSDRSEIELERPNETTEERRLRLARAYLRHVGVDEDAAVSDDEKDDADENDRANGILRENVLQQTGRATASIADDFTADIPKFTTRSCRGHALPPTCIAIAKGSEATAVSGGKDSRVIIWDVESGSKKSIFKPTVDKKSKRNPALANGHIGNILSVAITDDANLVVSGGDDQLIRVWDTRMGKLVDTLSGHRGSIQGLSFRSASRQLFSASKDRTVKIWDMNDMAYVETLFGHGAEINSIDSLSKERALSCGRDGTLRLYKVLEGSQLVFRRAQTMSIDVVAMVNEQRFISGGDDGAVCLWQLSKKKPTAVAEHAHGVGIGCESWISSVAAFRNTDLAVSGAGDGFLRFWKCEDIPKLVSAGNIGVGSGFVNGIDVGDKHNVLAAAVGSEHRFGRWTRVKGAKNNVKFISLSRSS